MMWPNPDPTVPQQLGLCTAILGCPWGPLSSQGTLPCVGNSPTWGTLLSLGTHLCHGDPHPAMGTCSCHKSPQPTSGTLPATEIPPEPLWHSLAGVSAPFPPNSPIFFRALPGRREPPAPSDGARSCSAAGRAFLPQIMTRDPRYRRSSRCSRHSGALGAPGAPGAPGVPGSSVAPGTPGAPGRCNRAGRWRRSGLGLGWGWTAGP